MGVIIRPVDADRLGWCWPVELWDWAADGGPLGDEREDVEAARTGKAGCGDERGQHFWNGKLSINLIIQSRLSNLKVRKSASDLCPRRHCYPFITSRWLLKKFVVSVAFFSNPTRFLSLLPECLLAFPIFILCCTYLWTSLVTYLMTRRLEIKSGTYRSCDILYRPSFFWQLFIYACESVLWFCLHFLIRYHKYNEIISIKILFLC